MVVCHTPFDRISIHQAFGVHGLQPLNTTWLDSARVARRTWEEVAWSGYGLANVCRLIGYEFEHHDALEDAKAAGQVMISAMGLSGLNIQGWLRRVELPISSSPTSGSVARAGNPEGPLFGEVMAFTGALHLTRQEAADLAAKAGCRVTSGVTRHTTMLVIGDQDASRLKGHTKSSKHRKAEQLVAAGQTIRILRESDFIRLVGQETLDAGA